MAMMWGSACHSHLASEAVLTRRGRSFEKLGSASEECGDTPERGRWVLGSELAFANTDLLRAWSTTCESGCGNPSVTLPRNKARSFHECPWYTLSI